MHIVRFSRIIVNSVDGGSKITLNYAVIGSTIMIGK